MSKNHGQGKHQPTPVLQAGEEQALSVPEVGPAAVEAGSLAELQQQIDAQQAKNRPVQISQREEAFESLAKPQTFEIPATGDLTNLRRPDLVLESAESLNVDMEAFMNELVIINIAESGDPTAENPVMLSINGRAVYVKRGEDSVVRRCYVEQLLRAKPVGIRTEVGRDQNGDPTNKITKTPAMKYPFAVVRDDNVNARAWMRKILSES
jgi:hypothetical protein